MFLRDLILGRKPELTETWVAATDGMPGSFQEERAVFLPADGWEGPLTVVPLHRSEPVQVPAIPARPTYRLTHAAVLRRVGVVVVPGGAPLTERLRVVIDRLGIVHDPNEVVISGRDRTLRLVLANRRLISAQANMPGRKEMLVSFHKKPLTTARLRQLAVLLTEFCAGPVDLVMTESPVSGVFGGESGLATEDLAAALGLGPAAPKASDTPAASPPPAG